MRTMRGALLVLALGMSGCIDPASARLPLETSERALVVFMVLDPQRAGEDGRALQPAVVTTSDVSLSDLSGLEVDLRQPDGSLVRGQPTSSECPYFGSYAAPRACVVFEVAAEHGAAYELLASADNHNPITASAVVPGAFEITEHVAQGGPPGTGGLTAEWTPSPGAYRYLVAVRAARTPGCFPDCDGWMAITSEPRFSGVVSSEALTPGQGPWFLDVYALDRPLHDYLVSGTPGDLFSVPPASNVQGGHGVVGAWVRRTVPLP